MDLFGNAVVFIIIWWLVLFMVLPFGASPPEEPQPGTVESAPAKPRLGIKMIITTLIALALTFAVDWIADSGLISLREAGGG